MKAFLGLLQEPIEDAANRKRHLLTIEHDWLVIDPFPFLGPPEVHAAFTSVVVRDHDIVARLGELSPREEKAEPSGVQLAGGVLRTQKTVFFGATLHLVAQDGGALVIDPARLSEQLLGSVIQNTKEGDVAIYLPGPDKPSVTAIVTPAGGPEETKTPPEPARPGEQ